MAQPLIFLGLDPAEVERIVAGARKRAFRRGDIVFHQGDPGDSLQVVVRGHFALRLTTSRGDIFMNRIFPPGDMFGRVAVAPLEAVREATVVCLNGGETFEGRMSSRPRAVSRT